MGRGVAPRVHAACQRKMLQFVFAAVSIQCDKLSRCFVRHFVGIRSSACSSDLFEHVSGLSDKTRKASAGRLPLSSATNMATAAGTSEKAVNNFAGIKLKTHSPRVLKCVKCCAEYPCVSFAAQRTMACGALRLFLKPSCTTGCYPINLCSGAPVARSISWIRPTRIV